ncbi:MAG TPA: hypothetical protein VFX35_02120, partial [Solirubrobacterales bacterium]|nr:hypothetical protein [Solirubrobacterales bacterium]
VSVPERKHGEEVLDTILKQCGGIPVIVCSDAEDAGGGLVRRGAQADPFGLGSDLPMLSFYNKEDLPECKRQIKEYVSCAAGVADIELTGVDLNHGEGRAIQVFARRAEGAGATLSQLGGHSAEKTLRVEVRDSEGRGTRSVVAKIGDRPRIKREANKVRTMATRLPPDLMIGQADIVIAGAARKGGVFYGFADRYDRNVFTCLSGDEAAACSAVDALMHGFSALHSNAVVAPKRFSMLRRDIVGSDGLVNSGQLEGKIRDLDDLEMLTSSCIQHGDLHGENILVDRLGKPVLIDYAKTANACGCLDAITLELSAVFHPGAQAGRGAWPSVAQMSAWADLDSFVIGCPYPEFIKTVRNWALGVAESQQEIEAVALAYVLRQLRYSEDIRPLALAFAESTQQRLAS